MKFSFVIPSICHGIHAQEQFRMLFQDCISTLVGHNGEDHEIIVVDDGSEQRMQSQIAQECMKRNVKLLINQVNSGFPKTVNKGMQAATGDIIVLVNNDVKFTQNVTEPILKAFEMHPKIGIVGSLLFYPHGTIQHGGILPVGVGQFTHRAWHKTLENAPEVHKNEYLIAVTGALFAVKRECMEEIGYLNENYFLACDDTEYCIRAWDANWRIMYSPSIRAIHAEGHTRGANDRDKLLKNRSWYIKERETLGKFNADVQEKYAHLWQHFLDKVMIANRDLNAVNGVTPVGACEKKIYGKGLVQGMESADPMIGPRASGKILAIRRTGALGDVLLTTGLVKHLKDMHPDHDIWFSTVVPEVFKNNPYVKRLIRSLDQIPHPVDKLIDLDNAYERNPKVPMVEAYAAVALPGYKGGVQFPPELYSTEYDLGSLNAKLGGVKLGVDRIAVLHMAVGWPSRTFSRQKWNEVTKKLSTMGYKCVIIGRGGDYRSDLYGNVLNLVDHLTIHEIRELMKKSSVFVGMDSGMLHVALTTDIPAVGVFTVANPDFRIIERQAKTVALVPKVHCRYCLHEQPTPVNFVVCKYGTNHCLEDFTSQAIVEAASEAAR